MHNQENQGPRVIVAMDLPDADRAMALVERLSPALCRLKVGKELFTGAGPGLVRRMVDAGFDVFLDLKYHDIPNTVAAACRQASELGVWMINVHASGGRRMMEAAREAVGTGEDRPYLVGVTVLTSMNEEDLAAVGVARDPRQQVLRLAALSRDSGLDGVVCSAREVTDLRAALGDAFLLVTPGIRPSGSARDDQRRVMTPREAIEAGSDYLVVGRPVVQAQDPVGVLEDINRDLSIAL